MMLLLGCQISFIYFLQTTASRKINKYLIQWKPASLGACRLFRLQPVVEANLQNPKHPLPADVLRLSGRVKGESHLGNIEPVDRRRGENSGVLMWGYPAMHDQTGSSE
jgi:hypothetical protein